MKNINLIETNGVVDENDYNYVVERYIKKHYKKLLLVPLLYLFPDLIPFGVFFIGDISDDFNRANSATVGGGWTELETAGTAAIVSNQLKLLTSSNGAVVVYQNHGLSDTRNYSWRGYIPAGSSGGARRVGYIGLFAADNSIYQCLGYRIGDNSADDTYLFGNGYTTYESGQLNWTNSNYVWFDVTPNGASNVDIKLYVSTSSTKPGSPSLSLTNIAPPATALPTFRYAPDFNSSGQYCFLDYIVVSSAVSGPANVKTYNTNLKANIKSINTNLIANVKSLNTNV